MKIVILATGAVALALTAVVSTTATARAARRPNCLVPKGDRSFSDATVVITEAPGPIKPFIDRDPDLFRYCLRSSGRSHEFSDDGYSDTDAASIDAFKLSGTYVAYVDNLSFGEPAAGAPPLEETNVADAGTGKTFIVHAVELAPSTKEATDVRDLTVSSDGVVAETVDSYSRSLDAQEEYVLAFQASTDQTMALGAGGPGTLGNVRIFKCAAGCASTAPDVVGWTSDGTLHFAGA